MLTDGVMVLQHTENDDGILLLNESLKTLLSNANTEKTNGNTATNGLKEKNGAINKRKESSSKNIGLFHSELFATNNAPKDKTKQHLKQRY